MITHSVFYDEKSDLLKVLDSLNLEQKIELALYCTRSIFSFNKKELPLEIFDLADRWINEWSKSNYQNIDILRQLNHLLTVYSFNSFNKNDHISNELDILSGTIRFIILNTNPSGLMDNLHVENTNQLNIVDIVWGAANFSNHKIGAFEKYGGIIDSSNFDESMNRLMEFKRIAISYFSKSNQIEKYYSFVEDRDINSILVLLDNMEDNNNNELFIRKDKWYFNIPYLKIFDKNLDSLKIRIRDIIRKGDELSYRITNYIRNLYRKYNIEEEDEETE